MAIKNALRQRRFATVNSGAVGRVYLDDVHHGKIFCYQRISWEISQATALGNTRCRLAIEGHGYDLSIAEQNVPVANTLYWIHDPNWLYSGEQLVLLVDQPQDGTVAQVHGIGYWVEEKEGIV